MHKYKDLKIWNKAIDLVVNIYQATIDFPKEEKYGITSQIRRSAVSIPYNIAEGAGRNHDKEFIQFLAIANGSSYELETQIVVARKLELLAQNAADDLCQQLNEIQKMNYNFQEHLQTKIAN